MRQCICLPGKFSGIYTGFQVPKGDNSSINENFIFSIKDGNRRSNRNSRDCN